MCFISVPFASNILLYDIRCFYTYTVNDGGADDEQLVNGENESAFTIWL